MKLLSFLILAFLFTTVSVPAPAKAEECDEPEPTGGAICESDKDCNGRARTRGKEDNHCNFTIVQNVTVGKCICGYEYGMEDCSYKRYNKDLAGGLQFIAFAGVGGVGNFVAGRIGPAVGQLLMMLAMLCTICVQVVAVCCTTASDSGKGLIAGATFIYLCTCLLCLASLAGFIWCMVDAGLFFGGQLPDGNGYYPYDAFCSFVQG